LVEEGKLAWDRPVRESVPAIEFYNDDLNRSVTLRDMLSHRTGITRHDSMWYRTDFTRKELFDRIKTLQPAAPVRQTFLYNNLMYSAVGQIIEIKSGKTWEDFVRERIFQPLDMKSSTFSVAEMKKNDDRNVPWTERRDSFELYELPDWDQIRGAAPAGAIITNINELSNWLIALMNDGKYNGKQVIPPSVLRATMQPALAIPNINGETRGWWELINAANGMGRNTASYRGNLITYHGGDLPGNHSQISYMPQHKIGVIVFVSGDHPAPLYNPISYNIYERLLGLSETPWSERLLDIRLKQKKAGIESRAKAGGERVPNTRPSHAIADYAGEYENPSYGALKIIEKDGKLQMSFPVYSLPLEHFHYDRFDTPNDERYGKLSFNFGTNFDGDIDTATVSLDEAAVTFTRKPVQHDAATLARLAGTYETPTGLKFDAVIKNGEVLLMFPQPIRLLPYKGVKFRIKEFPDQSYEFLITEGMTTAIRWRGPSGELIYPKK
jgi:CubicO group peptidase (beta-lactamase class C family)